MAEKVLLNIMGTRCRPEQEAKFNKWYEEVHIPLGLKFKGMKGATRCKIANAAPEYPTYITIYEFESRKAFEDYGKSPELAAMLAEMKETWKDGGFDVVWRVQYEVLKTWRK